jgi:mannose/cellobiose epimerase-like protein (N-acyl-D-glucosamine 2-epimerase family)
MNLQQYKNETQQELEAILHYWMHYAVDKERGGFYGRIGNDNSRFENAPKGVVLNARILWTFAAAYNSTKEQQYLVLADRAYQYIVDNFVDNKYGGVYWSVDATGKPLDTKKQIYALAFVIYGCSEYYKCRQHKAAKQLAIHTYELIQQYSYDSERGGYLEAFARDWRPLEDLRLSEKDANSKKTTNTMVHWTCSAARSLPQEASTTTVLKTLDPNPLGGGRVSPPSMQPWHCASRREAIGCSPRLVGPSHHYNRHEVRDEGECVTTCVCHRRDRIGCSHHNIHCDSEAW